MMPEIDIGTDGISITIKAVGSLFYQTKTSTKTIIEGKSRLEVIKALSGGLVKVEPASGDERAKQLLGKLVTTSHNLTDWAQVKKLLDASNCKIYEVGSKNVEDLPVYEIVSGEFIKKRTGYPRFVLWGQINPNKGVFPVIGLRTTVQNVLFATAIGLNSPGVDSSTKKTGDKKSGSIGAESTNQITDSVASSDGSTAGAKDTKDGKNVHTPKRDEENSMLDILKSEFHNATESTLKYEIDTVGIFDLLPGRSAHVQVYGPTAKSTKMLSGDYDLLEVSHELSESGAQTTCFMARTAGVAAAIDVGLRVGSQKGVAAGLAAASQSFFKKETPEGVID